MLRLSDQKSLYLSKFLFRERERGLADLRSMKIFPLFLLTILLVCSSVYAPSVVAESQTSAETLLEGLNHPTGLAVDSVGNIYFSEFGGEGALMKYGVDGRVTTLISNMSSAAGVAVGVGGEVYVVERANGILWRLAPGSQEPTVVLEELGMWDLAVDGGGNMYITVRSVNGSILKLPRWSDRAETLLSGLNIPTGVTVDGQGDVYFVEFGNVTASDGTLKKLPKGQSEPVTLLAGLRGPYDVAVDDAGKVYFTERIGTLKVLKPGGEAPELLLLDLGRVYGLALDGRGGLLLVTFGSPIGVGDGTLLRLDVSGAVVNVESGKAQISIPEIAAGKMVVVTIGKSEETSVRNLQISVKNNVNNIQVTITNLDEKPASVAVDASGKVYHYLNVDKQNIEDEDISAAKIVFQVEKSWIDSNNVDRSTISLQRYEDGRWNKLPTSEVGEDEVDVYYEAESAGLSIYAISGESPWAFWGGWVWVTLALVIIAGSSSVFILRKKWGQDARRRVEGGIGGGGQRRKSSHESTLPRKSSMDNKGEKKRN